MEGDGRSARKRQAIVDAATTLFLRDGYRNTSMDQVAADAQVSKQTVYKHFSDKEQLFRGIILGVTANAQRIIGELTAAAGEVTGADGMREQLVDLAARYLDGVLRPNVLALRRLVVAEAERFPDLAATYYEQAVDRGVEVTTELLRTYERQGLLQLPDARLAGAHFAYLALGIAQDRALFHPAGRITAAERARLATEAVRVFLAAYTPA